MLVINGLLTGVSGPNLFKNVGKSEIITTKVQIDALSKTVELFRPDNGRHPNANENLSALVTRPANTPTPTRLHGQTHGH